MRRGCAGAPPRRMTRATRLRLDTRPQHRVPHLRPSATEGGSMRSGHLVVLAFALALSSRAVAVNTPAATCMRASGNAAARCLDRQADVIARCRSRGNASCEQAARAPGGALDVALDRVVGPDGRSCTDDASEPL